MAQVIALSAARAERRAEGGMPDHIPKPKLSLPDILGMDYSTPHGALFAAIKIREALNYGLHEEQRWRDMVLEMTEAAYSLTPENSGRLLETVLTLKHYVAAHTGPDNRKDLGMVSILLSFLEKSLIPKRAMGQ